MDLWIGDFASWLKKEKQDLVFDPEEYFKF